MARFCRACGRPMSESARFCSACGVAAAQPPAIPAAQRKPKTAGNTLKKALIGALALVLVAAVCVTLHPGMLRGDGIKPVTVEREAPQALQTAGEAGALALRQYVYARLLTEQFVSADYASDPGELRMLIDETAAAWENAVWLSAAAEETADMSLSVLGGPALALPPFSEKRGTLPMLLAARPFDPRTWAENLTKQYDAIKGGQTIKQLAQQLGTDAREAYAQLTLAQEIIHSDAMSEADRWDQLTKLAQATKTVCKVTLYVAATVHTGGGSLAALTSSSMTLGTAGGIVVGGADCIVDVASTGSSILLGEDHQVTVGMNDVKDQLAPVSAVVGLVSFNSSEMGEQISYIGDSLVDWFYEGKIMGVKVAGEGGVLKVTGEPVTVEELNEAAVEAALTAAKLAAPGKNVRTLSELMGDYRLDGETALTRVDALISQMASILQREQGNEGPDTDAPTVAGAVEGWPADFYGTALPAPVTGGAITELIDETNAFDNQVTTIRIDNVTYEEFLRYCKTLEAMDGWVSAEDSGPLPDAEPEDSYTVRFAGSCGNLPRVAVFYFDYASAAEKGIPEFQMFVFETF